MLRGDKHELSVRLQTMPAPLPLHSALRIYTAIVWEMLFSKTIMQTDLRHSLLEQRPVSFAMPLYLPGSSNMEVLQPYHNSRTFTEEAVALSRFDWTISKYKAKVPQSEDLL